MMNYRPPRICHMIFNERGWISSWAYHCVNISHSVRHLVQIHLYAMRQHTTEHTHIHMQAHGWTHTHTSKTAHTYIQTHHWTHTYTHAGTRLNIHVYIRIHTHRYTDTQLGTHALTNSHAGIHTYINKLKVHGLLFIIVRIDMKYQGTGGEYKLQCLGIHWKHLCLPRYT